MCIEKQSHPLLIPAFQLVLRQRLEKLRANTDLAADCPEFSFGLRSNGYQFSDRCSPARDRDDIPRLDARQKPRKMRLGEMNRKHVVHDDASLSQLIS